MTYLCGTLADHIHPLEEGSLFRYLTHPESITLDPADCPARFAVTMIAPSIVSPCAFLTPWLTAICRGSQYPGLPIV